MKQGDIIWVDFDPTKGREQAGHRTAVVISRTLYNKKRSLALVCPITSQTRLLRFHVQLDERTKTKGDVICEQIKVIDLLVHKCKVIEQMPKDLLRQVLEAVTSIISYETQ